MPFAFRASFRDNNPELWETFMESYKIAVNSDAFQKNITQSGEIVVTRQEPTENARKLIADNLAAMLEGQ